MTQQSLDAYRAAWAAQSKIAAQRRLVITHVRWRDGQMQCQMTRPAKAAPAAEDRPSSSRGIAQGLLI